MGISKVMAGITSLGDKELLAGSFSVVITFGMAGNPFLDFNA